MHWNETIRGQDVGGPESNTPLHEILVPTVDTARATFLADICIRNERLDSWWSNQSSIHLDESFFCQISKVSIIIKLHNFYVKLYPILWTCLIFPVWHPWSNMTIILRHGMNTVFHAHHRIIMVTSWHVFLMAAMKYGIIMAWLPCFSCPG